MERECPPPQPTRESGRASLAPQWDLCHSPSQKPSVLPQESQEVPVWSSTFAKSTGMVFRLNLTQSSNATSSCARVNLFL